MGNKVYINSGTIASSDLYVFDGNTDSLMKHIPFSPLGKDGHGLMVVGKYLWMGNRASGNMSRAARIAGADRTTLYRLMEKHGLQRETIMVTTD